MDWRKSMTRPGILLSSLFLTGFSFAICAAALAQERELYVVPDGVESRWSSFENPHAAKGKGGAENQTAKGHAFEVVLPGQSRTLLDEKGAGIVQRIWITISERSPAALRSARMEMYWDDASEPAVNVPVGDFFGLGLGRLLPLQNALFSDPEGRSFTSYIPMPYRKAARIVFINDSDVSMLLFYDVDFLRVKSLHPDAMYFHAYWSRNAKTALRKDFDILPEVKGKGRFLGSNLGMISDPKYLNTWWGEGEAKIYLDGDTTLPTLNGTGSEDFAGSGWGLGTFAHMYQGSPVADEQRHQWAFYRYHIPDAVYFHKSCRVAMQVLGGAPVAELKQLAANGVPFEAATVGNEKGMIKLLEQNPVPKLSDLKDSDGFVVFYREIDYSATAYFYLDAPSHDLPPLPDKAARTAGLPAKYE
jgi:hypothetical protein